MQASVAANNPFQAHAESPGEPQGTSATTTDSALQALSVVARLHHVAAEPAQLRHQLGLGASDAVTHDHLLLAAQSLGLKAKRSRTHRDRLPLTPLPALALMMDGSVAVLAQCDGQRVLRKRPAVAS